MKKTESTKNTLTKCALIFGDMSFWDYEFQFFWDLDHLN